MPGPPGPRIGFTFTPQLPPEQLKRTAIAADEAGLDEFWLWEDCFSESGVACAAAVLGWTERIPVKIGLLPVPLRNVAITAMEIASLDRLFPGRFAAGLGHGVQSWMDQIGARPASPMTLLREHVTALRRLLDGERVTVHGTYVHLDDVQLDWPPLRRAPILLGGHGPRTLQLSAELGDGVLLPGNHPLDEVSQRVELIAAAASAAGKDGPAIDVTTTQIAATGPGSRDRAAREAAAWSKAPVPGVCVAGGPDELAAAVRELGQRGISAVTFMATRDDPDVEALCAVIGQARRLVHQPG